MPEAKIDDGRLDAVVIAPHGVFGWASVLGRRRHAPPSGTQRLDRLVAAASSPSQAKRPVEAEIDGDPIGEHRALAVRMLPDALVVRVG